MDKGDKKLIGALMVVGLGMIGSFIYTAWATNPLQTLLALDQAKTAPTEWYSADFVSPIATVAAPRMYVANNPGSAPDANPGESWLQGGGASITNTTGRWAA